MSAQETLALPDEVARRATKVLDMNISVRAVNALINGILHDNGLDWKDQDKITVDDVCAKTPRELLMMKSIGRRTLAEIVRAVEDMGMRLAGGPDAPHADIGHGSKDRAGPCRAERLMRYRCAALHALLLAPIAPGTDASPATCARAAEDIAHAMLAAEREGHRP